MYAHNTISLVHPLISMWAWQALGYSTVSNITLQAPDPELWKSQCTDPKLTADRQEAARGLSPPWRKPVAQPGPFPGLTLSQDQPKSCRILCCSCHSPQLTHQTWALSGAGNLQCSSLVLLRGVVLPRTENPNCGICIRHEQDVWDSGTKGFYGSASVPSGRLQGLPPSGAIWKNGGINCCAVSSNSGWGKVTGVYWELSSSWQSWGWALLSPQHSPSSARLEGLDVLVPLVLAKQGAESGSRGWKRNGTDKYEFGGSKGIRRHPGWCDNRGQALLLANIYPMAV